MVVQTLYFKNLTIDVFEACLLGIFFRFQRGSGENLILRLMHQGRMKGQTFVTLLGIYVFHRHKRKIIFKVQLYFKYGHLCQ
jgi:hypothetical protein